MEGSEESAAARWRQCGRLVQAVRAGTQEKMFYDDSVKALRAQLRAEFEALLLDDYRYAQVPDAFSRNNLHFCDHQMSVEAFAVSKTVYECKVDLPRTFEMSAQQVT